MIRKSKEKKSTEKMLDDVMEALDIEEVPELKCNLYHRKTAPLTYCTSKCRSPCSNFLQFRFITFSCTCDECDPNSPCSICLDEIEDMKTLIAAMHILRSKRTRQRIVSWNAWCNKMKKRTGNA